MRELLPHYERELSFLADNAKDFAKAYPRIAGRLSTSGNLQEDPHVERLIQSFALLSARVHKRLDDDFPRVTEALLEVLYPHYLRPFPSCSIAQFELGAAAAQLSTGSQLPAGTLLQTRPVNTVPCRFATCYAVQLLPLQVQRAQWQAATPAPEGTLLPGKATSLLSVELALASNQVRWSALGTEWLRVYLDGEPSLVSALREALLGHSLGCWVEAGPGPWAPLRLGLPRAVGFADADALLDFDARSPQAYRLLTEFFAFPEKFNFIDLRLPTGLDAQPRVTLHFAMQGLRADSEAARLLESFSARNLRLGCTPVINRFSQRAEPIRITHAQASYAVLPDARRAHAFEVYSVDRVFRVQQTPAGETVQAFQPFYGLRHEQLLEEGVDRARYWSLSRDSVLAERAPGYETEISIVDIDFDPAAPQTDTLSLDVTATNRDLPHQISIGQAGGDLFMEGGSPARAIALLKKPTRSQRFERGNGTLWRLVSHLTLNHLSLSGTGLEGLKELLRLYDLPRAASTARLLDGLLAIEHRPAVAWLPGDAAMPFPSFVRGTELLLTVEREAFVGTGLHLFAQVLDHFFGQYVHVNSFVQLRLICARSGETLVDCPRRSGSGPLI